MTKTTRQRIGQAIGTGLVSLFLVVLCAGCNITRTSGKGKDVSIETPLGGMQVKDDPAHVLERIGLPQYPGSTIVPKKHGSDDRAADVDMSFGGFHLRVLTLGLQTPDPQQAVEAFYRKSLAQYSDVIACRNHVAIAPPAKTGMGLTCSDDENARDVHVGKNSGEDQDELQLKAGSQSRQHIVAIKPQDGGIRVQLIALDLPHGDKD